ncbi:hypothetical protein SAMN04488498_12373 [Mesorhizobium albiziae]|uniref:Uncharacterized protein n=1 Tax=Neomesorhizobium albiziae TaxID=335020 RepID=A0A1I4E7C4_9HYPH|nr:hypothetical protein [Mesorhizobium albiziae]GLS33803.1 hypothetical protein GCM10007937_55160 [Mesorhizobium albiziae]SFL01708.1 hypothetical protein SAMN04488498_12373 [Mesorhizobium albiziae]
MTEYTYNPQMFDIQKEQSSYGDGQEVWALYRNVDGRWMLQNRYLKYEGALINAHYGSLPRPEPTPPSKWERTKDRFSKLMVAVVVATFVGVYVYASMDGSGRTYDDDYGCSIYWRC